MEKLKKSRSLIRGSFTKALKSLNDMIDVESFDVLEIQVAFEIVESKAEELQALDKMVLDLLLDFENTTENEFLIESSKIDEYVAMFKAAKFKVKKLVDNSNEVDSISSHNSVVDDIGTCKRKFKLPQIELKKFDGNLLSWLPFWSQFHKIHVDNDIVPEDKFQYLLQAVVPGTRAYELVNSYPPTESNYSKVIESLKARFGKDDLLVEVYVRELLKMVLQNALGNKNQIALQSLYDKLESHLRSLETLGVTTDKCASILYPLVESCMPEDILRAWQRSQWNTGVSPQDRLKNLMKFMLLEVEGEQRIGLAMSGFGVGLHFRDKERPSRKPDHARQNTTEIPSAASLVSVNKDENTMNCVFCGKGHKSSDCFKAKNMTLEEKTNILKNKKCCYCCLKPGHSVKYCKLKDTLRCSLPTCRKRHFFLMCPSANSTTLVSQSEGKSDQNKPVLHKDNVLANSQTKGSPKVFMQTIVVKLRNPMKNNNTVPVRLLIDTGSQRSYIVDSLILKAGYKSLGEEKIVHSLFGNVRTAERTHQRYRVYLTSKDNSYMCNFEALNQPVICGEIPHVNQGPWFEELAERNIHLTDIEDPCLPISILIGADVAGKLFTGNKVQLQSGLVAMETHLGWTLIGKVPGEDSRENCLNSVVTSMFLREADISDLWNLDLIGIRDTAEHQSKEERVTVVKQHFLETTTIDKEGRYEVCLPWVSGHPPLPNNKSLAEKRLTAVGKRLKSNGLFEDYGEVFLQWMKDGIIEVVENDEVNENCHYLPHKPVIKETSSTTRIRPVFDASAKERFSPSLNECIENGPNLIELIPSVMLRFREGRFGVIADIAKAFLQISLKEDDRDFLRFMWYDKESEDKIITYRHKRVVFGIKCSPFLLGAVLEFHMQKVSKIREIHPDFLLRLQKSFYVDNVSTSLDTLEELSYFMNTSRKILEDGMFDLRGWTSNGYNEDNSSSSIVNVLGIQWDSQNDMLFLNLDLCNDFNRSSITKRVILSTAHRLFDPIGFICPVMLYPKLLLQEMWNSKIDWDTVVNEVYAKKFTSWFDELPYLKEIKIPRWIGKTIADSSSCTIHVFCDGSKNAYGSVVFLRVENKHGVTVQLLAAKSRVVPLKKISIPRIELLAATVGARLSKTILESMNWFEIPTFYWSDSTTVLAWLKRESLWKIFVSNRVAEIKRLTQVENWNYVQGEHNPADLPSRGCSARTLLNSRWWEGPQWLRTSKNEWPVKTESKLNFDMEAIDVERRKQTDTVESKCLLVKMLECEWCGKCLPESNFKSPCCGQFGLNWYSRYFSDYFKIVRMLAWIQRFVQNCRSKGQPPVIGELITNEIEQAERTLLKTIQHECFKGVKDTRITSLDPFVGEDGLIRLKTKLSKNNDISVGLRYPILLPSRHPTVDALIFSCHKQNCHAGVQMLMNIMRENYWVMGGRKTVRSVISKCIVCKRQKTKRIEAPTATLPVERMKDCATFEITGSDFAGPLHLKKNEKAWICLFTCGVYRAIHLELVSSLSTEAFLQAFRRFIARRGRPRTMFSDNGTNYVGAKKSLEQIDWEEIKKFSSVQRIHWKLNPPSAPWWGGWCERLVKIVKELLRRVLGKACLSYQEMLTVVCDCEAIINSRPLTYIFDGDSDELAPLTPKHFLQDIQEVGVPDIDKIDESSLNKRLKYLQSLRQNLRDRFKREYLGQLVHRTKQNLKNMNILEVGDVVLVECDDVKRVDWPLAKVVEIMPDREGTVRLVKVKTSRRVLLRPVQKLYPLEVTSKEIESLKGNLSKTQSGRVVNPPERYGTTFVNVG